MITHDVQRWKRGTVESGRRKSYCSIAVLQERDEASRSGVSEAAKFGFRKDRK